jgi:signal transduction histidine kinase
MEDTADKAAAKQLKVNCTVDPDLPPMLVDRQRIGLVFANLLNNTIIEI